MMADWNVSYRKMSDFISFQILVLSLFIKSKNFHFEYDLSNNV